MKQILLFLTFFSLPAVAEEMPAHYFNLLKEMVNTNSGTGNFAVRTIKRGRIHRKGLARATRYYPGIQPD